MVLVDGCRQYNTGRVCVRSKKGGVGQYVHDSRLRVEAIKKKKADVQIAKETSRVAAKAIKETVKDGIEVSTNVVRSVDTQQALETPIATHLNAQLEVLSQRMAIPRFPDEFCRHFVRGYCKLEYCPLVHNHQARREFKKLEKDKTAKKKNRKKKNLPLKERNPNVTITKVIPPPTSQVNESSSKAIIPVVCEGPTTTFDIQSWDSITLKRWATRNLSPDVLHKYLRSYGSYIEKGQIPLSVLCIAEPKKTKKNALEPLVQFRLFSKLPYEIQDEIWMVYIVREEEQCTIGLQQNNGRPRFKCISPLPKALCVNRYLREQALRRYSFCFGTTESKPSSYFHFPNGRLFICNRGPFELLASSRALRDYDRERVRVLSIPLRDWIKGNKIDFVKAVVGFTGLKSLDVLVGNSREDEIYSKGKASILRKIEKLFAEGWRIYNGPAGIPKPNVHIKVVTAWVAKHYKIDGLVW